MPPENPLTETPPTSPPQAKPVEALPVPEPKEETPAEPSHLKQIRTYEGDVAEAIKKQNESLISIQQAERKKRDALGNLAPSTFPGEHHVNLKPLFLSLFTIIFIVGGGYGAYYAWTTYMVKTALPPTEAPPNQFVGVASVKEVDASILSRHTILDIVEETRFAERGSNSIEQIQMKRAFGESLELLSTEDFLTRLATHAPPPLVRAFSDSFMLGVLGGNVGHTILMIKLESFEKAFPGMLEWEPRIVEDLLPLFADEQALSSVPSVSKFEDKTIQNQDTRVLRDLGGKTVLIYGFFDNNMLIMTDGEDAFRSLINRLQSQKLSR